APQALRAAPHPGHAVRCARGHASQGKVIGQVAPIRVELLDQLEFPCAAPTFECRLPCSRFQNRRILFVIYQQHQPVGAREPRHRLCPVLGETPDEIVGHAGVEDTALSICKDVDEVSLSHPTLRVSRAQRSAKRCAADPGPPRTPSLKSLAVPEQRCSTRAKRRSRQHRIRDTHGGLPRAVAHPTAQGMTQLSTRLLALSLVLAAGPAGAQALDKVSFGTNWLPEAEHGGFYQALADGTYRRYGLDVTIVPGGPNVNNRILLPVGKLDFFMSANTLQNFDAVEGHIPMLAVAAMFQKDPQVLIAHPGQRIDKFEDLKKLTLFVSKEGLASYFQWLKADFGFSEKRVKPYTSNPQPFLADKRSAMQGYVTSEPFAIEKQARFTPKVFLLADYGFNSYSTLIETRRNLVAAKPDLV